MQEEIIGLIIFGFIFLLMLSLSMVLRSGKGAFLISGYNMMPSSEKAKYDEKALCRFVGNLLLVIDFLLVFATIGAIFEINSLLFLSFALIICYTFGSVIYANTSNHFKKK